MITPKTLSRSVALIVSLAMVAAPATAQQKQEPASPPKAATKTAQPDRPAPTIDTLFAADSYKVYGEVKNVGQLVSSGSISELIDPIMKLSDPPKEFKALVKFLNTNAEALTNSTLVFAAWPARPGIPNAIFTIELASPEEAVKFEPKLNRLLPVLLPTPTPTPIPTTTDEKLEGIGTNAKKLSEPGAQVAPKTDQNSAGGQSVAAAQPPPAPPPFVISRSGNLIFVTDKAFKFEKLRPVGSKLLNEEQNFRVAHDRFSLESIFIYFNVSLEDKTRPKPSPLAITQEEQQGLSKTEEQANARETAEMTPNQVPPIPEASLESPRFVASARVRNQQSTAVLVAGPTPEASPTPNQAQQVQMAAFSQFGTLIGLLGAGDPEWPDAVGVAITQETDDYVIRAILVGPQNAKRLVVPFAPQLLAGRAYTPNAPSVLPDETEIFVSASLDLPKTYDEMLAQWEKNNRERIAQMRKLPAALRREKDDNLYDPFSDFEKKGGFKIKEDLLPALGNEIAIAGSMKSLQGAGIMMAVPPSPKPSPGSDHTEQAQAQKQQEEQTSPMVLISIRDREAARRLMPMVLNGLGFGAANLIGTSVKRDDTEMVDFAGAFAYAFVGDFVVISTTATVRHVIDSHINRQTLASNSAFRNFTRWQPREIVGQVYVSPALMETYQKAARDPSQMMAASMREYLMRLNPTPQAITYALSNEGFGAIHELRLPKSFVQATVAGAASVTKDPPPEMNEAIAAGLLRVIVSTEATYQANDGKGSYGSLDKLIEAKLVTKEMFDKYGYRIEVTASGNQFEATAIPIEYGKSGRRSFFVDQSGVVRGDDHGGAPATVADKPVER